MKIPFSVVLCNNVAAIKEALAVGWIGRGASTAMYPACAEQGALSDAQDKHLEALLTRDDVSVHLACAGRE